MVEDVELIDCGKAAKEAMSRASLVNYKSDHGNGHDAHSDTDLAEPRAGMVRVKPRHSQYSRALNVARAK